MSVSCKKGQQVLVQVNPRMNNGDPEAVGFVTSVDDSGKETVVNVRALVDDAEVLMLRNVVLLGQTAYDKDDAPAKRAVKV